MTHPSIPSETKLPAALVCFAGLLFFAASLRYPGGYDWAAQSISSLFQPLSTDGSENPARLIAIVSVAAFCSGIAIAFDRIARRADSVRLRKTIQIACIGSMVYAFLVVTPMHDVMVTVAFAFFIVAMLATLRFLWTENRRVLVAVGLASMSGTVWNAVLYYAPVDAAPLPAVQKVSMLLWVVWLLTVYFSAIPSQVLNESRAPH
ncbi:MAG: hypothetical protein AAF389_18380 [Gemmatimonadota bacterium]